MKHKHICSYKHYFEDDKSCYLILELCHNQSMKELTKKRKYLSEPEVLFYMQQLIEAVQYMHENNIMHRDLKLGNLFLDKHLNIKVGDFGFATQIIKLNEKRNTARCGTPNYIAPEMLSKTKEGYSSEVDIWSMGIVCFTMLFGDPPFAAQDDIKATYVRILANDYWFPEDIPISHNARDFIYSILQTNPVNRYVHPKHPPLFSKYYICACVLSSFKTSSSFSCVPFHLALGQS
jgi:serine/threonine protein kinase